MRGIGAVCVQTQLRWLFSISIYKPGCILRIFSKTYLFGDILDGGTDNISVTCKLRYLYAMQLLRRIERMLPQGIFVIIVLISKRVIDIIAREKAWVS